MAARRNRRQGLNRARVSFDDLLLNLREALALHMEGEDPAWLGLSSTPRLTVSYETAPLRA
ncbi:MAG: hypothetical protein OXQ28_10495 [Acidobacteriota bacterium]|nr:hypothetical protein [Acidobacteriota bacterium]